MNCVQCGTFFADGMTNCPNCGAPVQPGMQGQPYSGGMGYASQQMTKKEFLHHDNLKKTRSGINSAAVIAYICAGITLIASLLLDMGGFVFLDVALLIGLGLGIQIGKSRVCSIILLVYSIINVIIGTIQSGSVSGILILIGAIDAVIFTFRFQKAWKEYQRSGIVPVLK